MKQPEIGIKVAERRQQKGMTQEKLAELCEVSARTIQRIESGEVDPRAFTINNLSKILEFDFGAAEENETFWLALLHLSSMFCIIFIPLLIWSFKKNKGYKIDKHGRDVLNFQITMNLLLFGAVFLLAVVFPGLMIFLEDAIVLPHIIRVTMVLAGILPLILIGFFCFFQGAANTTRVLNGKPYKYRLTIPFIK